MPYPSFAQNSVTNNYNIDRYVGIQFRKIQLAKLLYVYGTNSIVILKGKEKILNAIAWPLFLIVHARNPYKVRLFPSAFK